VVHHLGATIAARVVKLPFVDPPESACMLRPSGIERLEGAGVSVRLDRRAGRGLRYFEAGAAFSKRCAL